MLLARVKKISPVLPMFMFGHFSHHVATGSLVPLLPWLRDSFSLNYTQSGLLVSSFAVTYGLAQLPIVPLADRWSKTRVVGLGLIGVAIASVGMGLSTDFAILLAFLILMGTLGSSYHAPAASFLSQWFSKEERGRALGTHLIGGSSSLFVTPVVAVLIAKFTGDWRYSFIALGIPAFFLGVIITGLGYKYEKVSVAAAASEPKERVNILELVRLIGILVTLAMILRVVTAGINSFLPLYLVDKHGVSRELAGMIVGLVAGAGILGAPLGGGLSDRFGRKPIIMLSVILAGPMVYLITVVSFSLWMLGVIFLYGLFVSFSMPTMESFIADTVPWHRRATVMGIYFFLGQETAGIVTPAVGGFIDTFGLNPTFTGLAVVSLASSALVLLMRKQV